MSGLHDSALPFARKALPLMLRGGTETRRRGPPAAGPNSRTCPARQTPLRGTAQHRPDRSRRRRRVGGGSAAASRPHAYRLWRNVVCIATANERYSITTRKRWIAVRHHGRWFGEVHNVAVLRFVCEVLYGRMNSGFGHKHKFGDAREQVDEDA